MAEPNSVAPQDTSDQEATPAPPPAGAAPPAPPAGGTPPAPPPAPPPAGGGEPHISFPTAESFNKRIEREARKQLKEMGIEDPEEVQKLLLERKEAERAQMSENERLRADLAEANTKREAAELAAEEMRTRTRLAGVFAQKGVKNFDYGYYLVNQQRDKLGEGEDFDESAFLDALTEDPAARAALGVADAGAAPPAPPANTSPTAPGATPAPADKQQSPIPEKTVMDLSPDEWAKRKQELGLPA